MDHPKSIVLFGASGRTGKEVLKVATARGFDIRKFDKKNPTNEELRQTVRGTDGAVIVFGPRPPYTDIFCATMTQNIVTAMEAENVKHLLCQTGAMIGDYPCNRSLFFRIFCSRFKKSNPQGYLDRVKQEAIVKDSSLVWTIIKPPRLTDARDDKTINAGENIKVGLSSSVSRKSLAQFIITELVRPKYIRKTIFVKNN